MQSAILDQVRHARAGKTRFGPERIIFLLMSTLLLGSCADDSSSGGGAPLHTSVASATRPATGESPTVAPASTPTEHPRAIQPAGFPIDPETRVGVVEGETGSRRVVWAAGPSARSYSRDEQSSGDATRANRGGWNCLTHEEYEGRPAIDWYIPVGTQVVATMDGNATLYAITVANAFEYYGVDREPYLGDPDRSRAPLSPFPGPGGGKGVFVRIENDQFATEYAHLDITQTVAVIPKDSFLEGFTTSSDFGTVFGAMRDYLDATAIANWQVQRGDVIGISGDSGYSEAPHLHYTVARAGAGTLLCPTNEAAFADGGWLFRGP